MYRIGLCPRLRPLRAPRLDESIVQGVPWVEPAMHQCIVYENEMSHVTYAIFEIIYHAKSYTRKVIQYKKF